MTYVDKPTNQKPEEIAEDASASDLKNSPRRLASSQKRRESTGTNEDKGIYKYLYMYIYTYTHTHIYIYMNYIFLIILDKTRSNQTTSIYVIQKKVSNI